MKTVFSDKNVVNEHEYGFLLQKQSISAGRLYLNIPKIMALIPRGKPKTSPVSIPKFIVINSSDCKPTISNIKTQQNYLLVPVYKNADYEHKGDVNDIMHVGEKFIVNFPDTNILEYHSTGNI